MGMMGGGGGGAPAAGAGGGEASGEAAKEEEAAPAEKTHYDVELTAFDAATKIKLIKEIRSVLGLGLKEAKELVEAAPKLVQEGIGKDAAEEAQKQITDAGGKASLK